MLSLRSPGHEGIISVLGLQVMQYPAHYFALQRFDLTAPIENNARSLLYKSSSPLAVPTMTVLEMRESETSSATQPLDLPVPNAQPV